MRFESPHNESTNPPNSEVSDQILELLANSQTAVSALQHIFNSSVGPMDINKWICPFEYTAIAQELHIRHLVCYIVDLAVYTTIFYYLFTNNDFILIHHTYLAREYRKQRTSMVGSVGLCWWPHVWQWQSWKTIENPKPSCCRAFCKHNHEAVCRASEWN